MMTPAGLREFAAILGQVVEAVPEGSWTVRAADGRFALVEHVHHLADLEEEFGTRLRRIRAEENPFLPDFAGDVIASERAYLRQPLRPALARFVRERERTIATLQEIGDDEWGRAATQEHVGAVTLRGVAESIAVHDLAHANDLVVLCRELGTASEALAAFAARAPLARSA